MIYGIHIRWKEEVDRKDGILHFGTSDYEVDAKSERDALEQILKKLKGDK